MVELLAWTAACWGLLFVACAIARRALGPRWRQVAAASVVPGALLALVPVFLFPPLDGYGSMAARYWMSRAAAEPDAVAKEAHVRRVAFASTDHGWFVASQAIDSVEDGTQRCRLRTILAGLPGVRNREKLGNLARDECNASLPKGRN